jgi:RNA polymerase sigma factor (sigma-70 family)
VEAVHEETSMGMVQRVLSGDGKAWDRFAAHCQRVILSWCRVNNVSDTDLDDIVQESLLVVLVKVHEFRRTGSGSLRAWLRAIAWRCRCEAIAKSRSFQRLKESQQLYDRATADIESLEKEFDRLQELDCLERCLAEVRSRVQPLTWMAFQKHALEKIPGAMVSRDLGVPLESVYAAKWRVLRILRANWGKITGERLSLNPEFWLKNLDCD